MLQVSVSTNYEDSASKTAIKRSALNQHTVVFAELCAAMSTECLHIFDAFSTASAFQTERQVHTDDDDFCIFQTSGVLVEFASFIVTDTGI